MNVPLLLKSYNQRSNLALCRFMKDIPFQTTQLVEAMKYGLLTGGKRIRPTLVYATGEMLENDNDCLDVPAVAIECIHAYSLIHDDLPVMDNDILRRGEPTCHVKFGEANAILAGDALQTLAFTILSHSPMSGVSIATRLEMIKELSNASGVSGMCMGQALDLASTGQDITKEAVALIHLHKTGSLIRAAIRLGALTSDKYLEVFPALEKYAKAIGLAFQVQDDILNVVGNRNLMGKVAGSDKYLKKSTYPSNLGLKNSQQELKALYNEALDALSNLKYLNTTTLQAVAKYIIIRDK
ncbi:MAG: (2E,6E)-farnesyl diphosphate synthase [Candidatus Dasytiphilus stammeri]